MWVIWKLWLPDKNVVVPGQETLVLLGAVEMGLQESSEAAKGIATRLAEPNKARSRLFYILLVFPPASSQGIKCCPPLQITRRPTR